MSIPPIRHESREGKKARLVLFGATSSVLLGLVALILRSMAGLPALVLGFLTYREVNRSDGRYRGRWPALAGMVLGMLGVALDVVSCVSIVLMDAHHQSDIANSRNNLRMIGAASTRFELHNEYYPMGTLYPPQTEIKNLPKVDFAPSDRLAWTVTILPYVQRLDNTPPGDMNVPQYTTQLGRLYEQFDLLAAWSSPANREAVGTRVNMYRCSGHPHFLEMFDPPHTHYVGLAGLGPDATELPVGSELAGFFGYNRVVREKDLSAGKSYTVTVTETTFKNGPWAAGGFPTLRGVPLKDGDLSGLDKPFGGFFPEAFHVLMADGSVQFYRNDIPSALFRRHVTLAIDGE